MDGQEVRGWRVVRIREEEQYLHRESCLYLPLSGPLAEPLDFFFAGAVRA